MAHLDPARVRAALGTRLGDRFLQYATPPEPGETGRLLVRIDEHLAAAAPAALPSADRIARACKRLLLRIDGADPDSAKAIVAAARYFIDTYDLARDDGPDGYADDAQVVDYVIAEVAPDLAKVSS
jgi:hypothetical protein